MSLKTIRAAAVYWRLAIFRTAGKAAIAVVLSLAQALNGVAWSEFTSTQKFVLAVLAIASGWSVIDAFMDQTLTQIQRSDSLDIPEIDGDSRLTRETKTASVTTTTVEPKQP